MTLRPTSGLGWWIGSGGVLLTALPAVGLAIMSLIQGKVQQAAFCLVVITPVLFAARWVIIQIQKVGRFGPARRRGSS